MNIEKEKKEGSKINVIWIDDEEKRKEQIEKYRKIEKLRDGGGKWEEEDKGWWKLKEKKKKRKIEKKEWIREKEDEERKED